jgi:hypothetical protein
MMCTVESTDVRKSRRTTHVQEDTYQTAKEFRMQRK